MMYSKKGQSQIVTFPYIMAFAAIGVIVGAVIYNRIKEDSTSMADSVTNTGTQISDNVNTKTQQLINEWAQ